MNSLEDILINRKTADQLEAFLSRPAHGLLISGRGGRGKKFIAKILAADLLGTALDKLDNHPYFYKVAKDEAKSEISIDAARQLIKKLSLRVASVQNPRSTINRVAIIEDAASMSTEAQNAVLKLLEEPPEGSLIILTADSESSLLPTVVSRAQKISIAPVSLEDSLEFFGRGRPAADIQTAWRLSQGSAGLMHALLNESDAHPLKKAVDQAKEMLKMEAFERTVYLQKVAKDKAEFITFMEALSKVLSALQEAAVKNNRQAQSASLLKARRLVNGLLGSADTNANTRLLALSLALNMPV
jgi:DNA polymerase III subunit delta'